MTNGRLVWRRQQWWVLFDHAIITVRFQEWILVILGVAIFTKVIRGEANVCVSWWSNKPKFLRVYAMVLVCTDKALPKFDFNSTVDATGTCEWQGGESPRFNSSCTLRRKLVPFFALVEWKQLVDYLTQTCALGCLLHQQSPDLFVTARVCDANNIDWKSLLQAM